MRSEIEEPEFFAAMLDKAIAALAAIGGVVNGVEFSDPKFHPVWAKAEQLSVPLFIHPQGVPELRPRLQGNGFLTNVIGNPLETTIAVERLICAGVLARHPRVRLLLMHGGGFATYPQARADRMMGVVDFLDEIEP